MAIRPEFEKLLNEAENEGAIQLANDNIFTPMSMSGVSNPFSSENVSLSKTLRLNSHWLWVAADRYGKFAQSAKYGIYRESSQGEELLDTNHFLYQLIERPNPKMRRSRLWYLTVSAKQCLGNAFWYNDLNQYGLPAQFKFIYPSWGQVVPIENQFGEVERYEMMASGVKKNFTYDQIIHFQYPSLNSSIYGKSPGMAIMETHEFDLMLKMYYSNMMKNGGFPAHYFYTDQQLGKIQRDEFEQAYNQKGGYDKAGKAFLVDRGIKHESLGFAPKDFESNEFLRMNRDQFSQAYALSKSVMTISDSTNRADAEAGIYVTARFGFQPALDDFGEDLTYGILKKYDDYVSLKFDSVVADDDMATAQVYDTLLKAGVLTTDEVRKEYDRAPLEGGIGSHAMSNRNAATLKDVVEKKLQNFFAEGNAVKSGGNIGGN